MKIEYFDAEGVVDCPLILIYGCEPEAADALVAAVRALSQEEQKRVAVHELPGFESVDKCELFFTATKSDKGVYFIAPPRSFECSIQPLWWGNVLSLLETFDWTIASHRHQYLDYGWYTEFTLIISTDRSW